MTHQPRLYLTNYLARSHPQEFAELLKDGEEEAAQRYDRLGVIMNAFKPREQG
jgi:hypothetical protein